MAQNKTENGINGNAPATEAQTVVSTVMTFFDENGFEYHRSVEYDNTTQKFKVDGLSEMELFEETKDVLMRLSEAIMSEFSVDAETARDVIEALTSEGYDIPIKAKNIAEEIADKGFASDLVETLHYCEESQRAFDWLNVLENPYETILGSE